MRSAKLYTQVMALFDRFSTLTPEVVTRETQQLVARMDPTVPARLKQAVAVAAAVPDTSTDAACELWAHTAKLLAKSGSWSRALAVVDGLPSGLRSRVAGVALRERWPVPAEVSLALHMSAGREGGLVVPLGPSTGAARAVSDTAREPVPSPSLVLRASPDARDTEDGLNSLVGLTIDDILTRAFACRPATSAAAAVQLGHQQAAIARELQRRGAIREALQCVVNWLSRGLVVDRFYSSQSPPHSLSARGSSEASAAALDSSFDAIAYLRPWLFPPPSERMTHRGRVRDSSVAGDRGATTSAAPATRDVPWRVALDGFPLLFARCVRDANACEHFVVSVPSGDACTALTALLAHVEALAQAPRPSTEDVEVLWRAVGRLARVGQPGFRAETRANKTAVLTRVAAALEATHRVVDGGAPGSAGLTDVGSVSRGPLRPLSGKTVTALRGVVESLCVCLPQNPAQVRFLGLPLFARVGLALESIPSPACDSTSSLAVRASTPPLGLPNGLVQCLLLCLGDRHVVSAETCADTQLTKTALFAFLSVPPMDRHAPALDLLRAARNGRWFRVSATHLQCLLGGLQSVSIARTWQQALACVDVLEREFRVQPGDGAMPALLLNLNQDSWQRAFDVLAYYEGGAKCTTGQSRRVPATVMRDLHLISVKHASWTVTLQLLDRMLSLTASADAHSGEARRARATAASTTYVGFMNYLYGVYAAATGGRVDHCLALYTALDTAPGRRSGTSAFNEVTTAAAAVAFLDVGHYVAVVQFAEALLSGAFAASEKSVRVSPAKNQPRGRPLAGGLSPRAGVEAHTLTPAGADMARAAQLLGLLHRWWEAVAAPSAEAPVGDAAVVIDLADVLVSLLNSWAGPTCGDGSLTSSTEGEEAVGERERDRGEAMMTSPCPTQEGTSGTLPRVLRFAVQLQCMLGMAHLHAPIRLVFETVAGPGAYESASAGGGASLETRQVSYHKGAASSNRSAQRALYIPPSHQVAQAGWLARALGRLARDWEAESKGLSAEATRAVAEGMAGAGVGMEFLQASFSGSVSG